MVTDHALSRGDLLCVDYGDLMSSVSIAVTKDGLKGDQIAMGAYGTL